MSYSYRYNDKSAAKKFGDWLGGQPWAGVLEAVGSEQKAEVFQALVDNAIAEFFPLRTVKRRDVDPPWINGTIKRMIRWRKRLYKEGGGRTADWKCLKKRITKLIEKRKKVYHDSQREALLMEDCARNFFKNTKNYMMKEKPVPFDVMNMFPGRTESDVAELLAVHFNTISSEFSPLYASQIPNTYNKQLPMLTTKEVALRLKKFRKPKSVVRGDIFPNIVTAHADALAVPLASIYNTITTTRIWPTNWKRESVTIIPKCRTPMDVGQLRNISCTVLILKIYESYVLQWTLEQVQLNINQFGGSKGCSTSHLLISIWQNVLTDLEDCRGATLLTAIDYAKAFNRMSFQECLRSLARHGSSNQVIGLIAAFLTDRTMSVRVGSSWNKSCPVFGGVPQGSILGVLLFNVTMDNLEDDPNTGQDDQNRAGWDDEDEGVDGQRAQSTPIHAEFEDFEPAVTPMRRPISSDGSFVFLNSARNVPRSAIRDLDRTILHDSTPPPEPNPKTS